jgi:signal transduction histidine kinase
MTLYRKTLWGAGITIILLTLIVFLIANSILLRSYEQLEAQDTTKNVERVVKALQDQVDAFNLIALGWSKWDDVRDFVYDRNQRFIDVNLPNGMYDGTDLQITLLLNAKHEIVHQKAYDMALKQEVPVPPALLAQVKPGSLLLNHPDINSEITGLLQLPEGTLIVSSLPILNSEGTGPIHGTLIWAKYLAEEEIAQLASTTQIDVALYQYDDPALSADLIRIKGLLGDPNAVQTYPVDQATVAGVRAITDVYGNPILLAKVEMPRLIFALGTLNISYFLGMLLLLGAVFVGLSVFLLNRNVLRPVAFLSEAVTRVRTSDDLHTPVAFAGSDEIATLSHGLQAMLDALATSRAKLKEANDQLEQRVAERTQELNSANAMLRQEVYERQQAQQQVSQARDEAVDALRVKSQILANVSHDARTPLTAILLHADLLRSEQLRADPLRTMRSVDSIVLGARQLLNFVQNLVSEAQLNADAVALEVTTFAPGAVVDEVAMMMEPFAVRGKLDLHCEIAPALPATVTGDVERVRQVILNVVDNAIKFTASGGVTVRASRYDDQHWQIRVEDTGQGIAAEHLPHLFDAFWQLDGSATRSVNRGVGLGLSIVKQLITRMGGQVSVESALGKGTTVTLTLPVQAATSASQPFGLR